MKKSTPNHPKYKALMRTLDIPDYKACGILKRIWLFASDFAPDGDLTRFLNGSLASAIGYEKNEKDLIEALVKTGWLDYGSALRSEPSADGFPTRSVHIHDWDEHQPSWLKRKNKGSLKRRSGTRSERVPNDSSTVQNSTVQNSTEEQMTSSSSMTPQKPVPTSPEICESSFEDPDHYKRIRLVKKVLGCGDRTAREALTSLPRTVEELEAWVSARADFPDDREYCRAFHRHDTPKEALRDQRRATPKTIKEILDEYEREIESQNG